MHCGASVRELYGALQCFIALPFPTCMHTSYNNNSLIPRSSPPPTVACKTRGEECLGRDYGEEVQAKNAWGRDYVQISNAGVYGAI